MRKFIIIFVYAHEKYYGECILVDIKESSAMSGVSSGRVDCVIYKCYGIKPEAAKCIRRVIKSTYPLHTVITVKGVSLFFFEMYDQKTKII